jgi:hypothetical protein
MLCSHNWRWKDTPLQRAAAQGLDERAALLNNGHSVMFRLVGRPRYMRAWLNDEGYRDWRTLSVLT